jgi:hypothetical protein
LALQIKLCLTSNETKEIPIRNRKEHGKKLRRRRRRSYGKTQDRQRIQYLI